MSDRIEPFAVVVAAGTTQLAPATTDLVFNDGIVDRLVITVPPGPSGLSGFQILYDGQSVIPYTGGQFIVADNRVIDWDMHNYPTGQGWQIRAYNTDVYDHTYYLEFHITEIPINRLGGLTPVPIE